MIIKPLVRVVLDEQTKQDRIKAMLEGDLSLGSSRGADTGGMRLDDKGIVFEGLPVGNVVADVIVYNDMLASGKVDYKKHLKYVKDHPGSVMPSGLVQYAMDYRAYCAQGNPAQRAAFEAYRTMRREDWTTHYPYGGSYFDYVQNQTASTIHHLGLDGKVHDVHVDIPEFTRADNNWSYLTLAEERASNQPLKTKPIPNNAKPFLAGLLGPDYEHVSAVYQALAPLKDGSICREVRVWTPTLTNRENPRALVLGVGNDDWFGIGADGSISSRPARGVAVVGAKKSP